MAFTQGELQNKAASSRLKKASPAKQHITASNSFSQHLNNINKEQQQILKMMNIASQRYNPWEYRDTEEVLAKSGAIAVLTSVNGSQIMDYNNKI